MRYITGIHALNLSCELATCGDWHTSALKWQNIHFKNTEDSIFGDYGIEKGRIIPEHTEKYYVANHIRSLLDLLDEGKFSVAQGMRDDFICNERYTDEIFNLVYKLKNNSNWDDINKFMRKEYRIDWLKYLEGLKNDMERWPL